MVDESNFAVNRFAINLFVSVSGVPSGGSEPTPAQAATPSCAHASYTPNRAVLLLVRFGDEGFHVPELLRGAEQHPTGPTSRSGFH